MAVDDVAQDSRLGQEPSTKRERCGPNNFHTAVAISSSHGVIRPTSQNTPLIRPTILPTRPAHSPKALARLMRSAIGDDAGVPGVGGGVGGGLGWGEDGGPGRV